MSDMYYQYQTISVGGDSSLHWDGIQSQKFSLAERKHYAKKDKLSKLEALDNPILGRKHFAPTYSSAKAYRSGIRAFPDSLVGTMNVESPIRPRAEFVPTTRPYGHKERLHLRENPSGEWAFSPSLKVYNTLEISTNERTVDKLMGRRRVIDSLEELRNQIEMRSGGDKIYKHPEYAPGFFQPGGLVVGSTNQMRKSIETVSTVKLMKSEKKGTLFKDRLKQEEKALEEKEVLDLFEWEQTTLKDGNPNWRDPDTVEPEVPSSDNKGDKSARKK